MSLQHRSTPSIARTGSSRSGVARLLAVTACLLGAWALGAQDHDHAAHENHGEHAHHGEHAQHAEHGSDSKLAPDLMHDQYSNTEEAERARHAAMGHTMPGDDAALDTEFRILNVFEEPEGFPKGELAYDPESRRLWMLSYGPPANTGGPSTLFEVDPEDGRVVRSAQMPFRGEFGTPSYSGDHLYQIIDRESKLYKISVATDSFGEIVETVDLPKVVEIDYDRDEPLRFPWISFRGTSHTPDKDLLAHAQDLGEFMTIDPQSGSVTARVSTMRALAGIAATGGPRGELLVLANSDPVKSTFDYHVRHFKLRAEHGTVPTVRYGKRAVHWVLLDGRSGEILASLRRLDPRVDAASVALIERSDVEGAPYGRFTFFGLGQDGVFTLEWTPGMAS